MSSKDKTRDKLMSSMRKTKAAVDSSKSGQNEKAQPTPENKAVAVKNKTGVASKSAPSSGTNKSAQAVDSYWTAKRVWPD